MVYQRLALELAYHEVAENLSVDSSTVQRVVQRFETTGMVSPAPYSTQHAESHQKLTPIDELLIIHLVLDRPSIYLRELQQELHETTGTEVSLSAICKFLHKNGFTRRRLTKVALQRSEKERQQYVSDLSVYKPEMFVFLDETGSDRRDAMRRFGYSLRGRPAKSQKLLHRGRHISAISAICSEGVLNCKVVEGSVTADEFQDYIDQCLLPKLMPFNGSNPKSIVIMDNATIHHVDHIVETLEQLGVLVHFLPPYSPDLNPIEEAFSKVKYVMKENEILLECGTDLETLVLMGVSSITSADCIGWMKDSGCYLK
jgi:transposase